MVFYSSKRLKGQLFVIEHELEWDAMAGCWKGGPSVTGDSCEVCYQKWSHGMLSGLL